MLERTDIHDVTAESDGEETTIVGHVHDVRDLGGVAFLMARDRTGTMQVVAKEGTPALLERVQELDREDVVQVRGTVAATEQAPGGVELVPAGITVVSEARKAPPLEVAKGVDADRSTRLDNPHLDVRRQPLVESAGRERLTGSGVVTATEASECSALACGEAKHE